MGSAARSAAGSRRTENRGVSSARPRSRAPPPAVSAAAHGRNRRGRLRTRHGARSRAGGRGSRARGHSHDRARAVGVRRRVDRICPGCGRGALASALESLAVATADRTTHRPVRLGLTGRVRDRTGDRGPHAARLRADAVPGAPAGRPAPGGGELHPGRGDRSRTPKRRHGGLPQAAGVVVVCARSHAGARPGCPGSPQHRPMGGVRAGPRAAAGGRHGGGGDRGAACARPVGQGDRACHGVVVADRHRPLAVRARRRGRGHGCRDRATRGVPTPMAVRSVRSGAEGALRDGDRAGACLPEHGHAALGRGRGGL